MEHHLYYEIHTEVYAAVSAYMYIAPSLPKTEECRLNDALSHAAHAGGGPLVETNPHRKSRGSVHYEAFLSKQALPKPSAFFLSFQTICQEVLWKQMEI